MATVIQEKPRSHEDRHPRWDRTQRAVLFDQYRRALQAQGLSLRQAAKALDVPRSTRQAWRQNADRWDDRSGAVFRAETAVDVRGDSGIRGNPPYSLSPL